MGLGGHYFQNIRGGGLGGHPTLVWPKTQTAGLGMRICFLELKLNYEKCRRHARFHLHWLCGWRKKWHIQVCTFDRVNTWNIITWLHSHVTKIFEGYFWLHWRKFKIYDDQVGNESSKSYLDSVTLNHLKWNQSKVKGRNPWNKFHFERFKIYHYQDRNE